MQLKPINFYNSVEFPETRPRDTQPNSNQMIMAIDSDQCDDENLLSNERLTKWLAGYSLPPQITHLLLRSAWLLALLLFSVRILYYYVLIILFDLSSFIDGLLWFTSCAHTYYRPSLYRCYKRNRGVQFLANRFARTSIVLALCFKSLNCSSICFVLFFRLVLISSSYQSYMKSNALLPISKVWMCI